MVRSLLRGVRYFGGGAHANSIVMRAESGTGARFKAQGDCRRLCFNDMQHQVKTHVMGCFVELDVAGIWQTIEGGWDCYDIGFKLWVCNVAVRVMDTTHRWNKPGITNPYDLQTSLLSASGDNLSDHMLAG